MIKIYKSNNMVAVDYDGKTFKYPPNIFWYIFEDGFYRVYAQRPEKQINKDPLTYNQFLDSNDQPYTSDELLQANLESIINPNVPVNSVSTEILFTGESDLLNGESIDSGYIDFKNYTKQQITIRGSASGLTFIQTLKPSSTGNESVINIPLSLTDQTFTVIVRERFEKIQVVNNTGSTVTNVVLQIKGFGGGSDGLTVTPLDSTIVAQSQAGLVRSVIVGEGIGDQSSFFNNAKVNLAGALLVGDFGTEVARGLIDKYNINKKFGRNSDIDTNSDPEDIWNGGGLYTGFDCATAQTIEFFSDSANDVGALVSSGTSTGGSTTTLIDTSATFVDDGVAAGDVLLNDTKQIHGFIHTVTQTTLTVFRMQDGAISDVLNSSGNSYRVATNGSAGASVCKFQAMLDSDYNEFSEYVIMNGTTAVDSVGTYLRQSGGRVIMSASPLSNIGEITGRQKTTTANITMVMPASSGQTAICCATVPAGKLWIIKQLNAQMARANGSDGSASMKFQARERGGAWQTKRFPEISSGLTYTTKEIGGVVFQEFTDVRWQCSQVSDNNTIVSSEFEYYEIDQS